MTPGRAAAFRMEGVTEGVVVDHGAEPALERERPCQLGRSDTSGWGASTFWRVGAKDAHRGRMLLLVEIEELLLRGHRCKSFQVGCGQTRPERNGR
jgi:hypothetical protein